MPLKDNEKRKEYNKQWAKDNREKIRAYYKQMANKNPEKYRLKDKLHARIHRERYKNECITRMGGKCQICGTTGPFVIFDIHHLNSSDKTTHMRGVNQNKSAYEKVFQLWLDNRILLLCANCHRKLHFMNNRKNWFNDRDGATHMMRPV